jgi:hypothetical protein
MEKFSFIFVLLQMKHERSVALLRKLAGHCSPLSSSRGRERGERPGPAKYGKFWMNDSSAANQNNSAKFYLLPYACKIAGTVREQGGALEQIGNRTLVRNRARLFGNKLGNVGNGME